MPPSDSKAVSGLLREEDGAAVVQEDGSGDLFDLFPCDSTCTQGITFTLMHTH